MSSHVIPTVCRQTRQELERSPAIDAICREGQARFGRSQLSYWRAARVDKPRVSVGLAKDERQSLIYRDRDLRELARHVAKVSGDPRAAERRLDQVDAMLIDILANPTSGTILSQKLPGWRVRHGGADRRITIVFRLTEAGDRLQIALVAFGGQNWVETEPDRSGGFREG